MRDLYLDPVTGDIALDASKRARLTTPGTEAVAQRLRLRLSLWRGEYAPDPSVGIPYADLLGTKGGQAQLEQVLRQAAASCPGVEELVAFSLTVDAARNASVSLVARVAAGDPVVLDAFRVTP